jgi:hypothetical protein
MQRRKEEIILNNCKLQEEKTYLKKIENVDYNVLVFAKKLQDIARKKRRHTKQL